MASVGGTNPAHHIIINIFGNLNRSFAELVGYQRASTLSMTLPHIGHLAAVILVSVISTPLPHYLCPYSLLTGSFALSPNVFRFLPSILNLDVIARSPSLKPSERERDRSNLTMLEAEE